MSEHEKFEERIRVSSATGVWDEETRRHLDACADCREQAEVLRFMLALAQTQLDSAPPDPQVVKVKAQIVNRERIDEHSAHTISNIQRAVWGSIAAAWALVLALNGSTIIGWARDFDLSEIVFSSVSGEGSFGLILLLVSLASITAMVAVHAILAEE
jgi:hypothetical protein